MRILLRGGDQKTNSKNLSRMSRITISIVSSVLLSLVFIHGIFADQDSNQESGSNQSPDLLSDREQHELRGLLPGKGQQFTRVNAVNGDDYHSNVELDKINNGHRYEIIDDGNFIGSADNSVRSVPNAPLVNKLLNRNRFSRGQYYVGKRVTYPLLNMAKEDKDYTFVGTPVSKPTSQEFASRAGIWASDFLRDLLMAQQTQNR